MRNQETNKIKKSNKIYFELQPERYLCFYADNEKIESEFNNKFGFDLLSQAIVLALYSGGFVDNNDDNSVSAKLIRSKEMIIEAEVFFIPISDVIYALNESIYEKDLMNKVDKESIDFEDTPLSELMEDVRLHSEMFFDNENEDLIEFLSEPATTLIQ